MIRLFGTTALLLTSVCLQACQPQAGNASVEEVASDAAADSGAVLFTEIGYEGQNPAFENLPENDTAIENPILTGFYPDPSITKSDDGYYMVHSTFAFFPGIPVFHSEDLVSWTQIGNAIDREGMLDFEGLGMSRGVFAPTIEYHDGTYYILNTCVDCEGNFYLTATDPAGPWSDPVWLPDVGGIDPSVFFDQGKAYVINNDAPVGEPLYEGHRAVWIREVNPETLQSIGEAKVIINGGIDITQEPVWIEGPHIYAKDGWYYLSAAEGGTSVNHSQVILRSRDVMGPYTPGPNNPVLTQRDLPENRPFPITSAGHADYVQDDDGNWWAAFLAVQPYEGNHYNTGRETFFLPVDWSGEWPVILPAGEEIPRQIPSPTGVAAKDGHSARGLSWQSDFSDGLGFEWMSLRDPLGEAAQFTESGLRLTATDSTVEDLGTPAYLARRIKHRDAEMSLSVDAKTLPESGKAGLMVFQNATHWMSLTARASEGGAVELLLEQANGGEGEIVASLSVSELDDASPLIFTADMAGPDIQFAFQSNGETQTVGPVLDARGLSTQTAGGFIGAVYGPYMENDAAP